MAHTVSPEKQHEKLLGSPLANWRGWAIYARCKENDHLSRPPRLVDEVLGRPNPPLTLRLLVARMRCSKCGSPPHFVTLMRMVNGREQFAPLLGRGVGNPAYVNGPETPRTSPRWYRGISVRNH